MAVLWQGMGSRPESAQVGEGSFGKALLVRSEAGSVRVLCVSILNSLGGRMGRS